MAKRRVIPVALLGLVLTLASFATFLPAQAAGPVHITSSPAIVQVGGFVDVSFVISTPEGSQGYGAYTVDITYSPSLVMPQCWAGRATCNANYSLTKIRLVDISVAGFKGGSIATIRFTGVAPGAFSFGYTIVTCTNPEGTNYSGCTGEGGGIQVEGGGGVPTNTPTSVAATATPTSTTILSITALSCGSDPEFVVLLNPGPGAVSLQGYVLQSDPVLSQEFPLGSLGSVAAGATITLQSGPAAGDGVSTFSLTGVEIYRNNDATDYARIIRPDSSTLTVNCVATATPTGTSATATATPTKTATPTPSVTQTPNPRPFRAFAIQVSHD